jgi:hypothetical protein
MVMNTPEGNRSVRRSSALRTARKRALASSRTARNGPAPPPDVIELGAVSGATGALAGAGAAGCGEGDELEPAASVGVTAQHAATLGDETRAPLPALTTVVT